MIKLIPRVENSKAMILLSPLLALTLTAVSALIIFIFILDDIKVSSVFFTLFVLPLTDSYLFPELLVKAAPLMIIGLGLSIGFRGWNMEYWCRRPICYRWNCGRRSRTLFLQC